MAKKIKNDSERLKEVVANPFKNGKQNRSLSKLQICVDITSLINEKKETLKVLKLHADFMAYAAADETILRKHVDDDFCEGDIAVGKYHETLERKAFTDHDEAAMRTVMMILNILKKPIGISGRTVGRDDKAIARYLDGYYEIDATIKYLRAIRNAIIDFGINAQIRDVKFTDEDLDNLLVDMMSFISKALELNGSKSYEKEAAFSIKAVCGRLISNDDSNETITEDNVEIVNSANETIADSNGDEEDGYIKITVNELETLKADLLEEGRAEGYKAALKELKMSDSGSDTISNSDTIVISDNNDVTLTSNDNGDNDTLMSEETINGTADETTIEVNNDNEAIDSGADDNSTIAGTDNVTLTSNVTITSDNSNDTIIDDGSDEATIAGGNDDEVTDSETISSVADKATIDSSNVTIEDNNDDTITPDNDTDLDYNAELFTFGNETIGSGNNDDTITEGNNEAATTTDNSTISSADNKPLTVEGAEKYELKDACSKPAFLCMISTANRNPKILTKILNVDVNKINSRNNSVMGNLATVIDALPEHDKYVYFIAKEGDETNIYRKSRSVATIAGGNSNDTIASSDSEVAITSVNNPVIIPKEKEGVSAVMDAKHSDTITRGTDNATITGGNMDDGKITIDKVLEDAFKNNIAQIDWQDKTYGNYKVRFNQTNAIIKASLSTKSEEMIFVNENQTRMIISVEYEYLGETMYLYYAVRNGKDKDGNRKFKAVKFLSNYKPDEIKDLGTELVDMAVKKTAYRRIIPMGLNPDKPIKTGDDNVDLLKPMFAVPASKVGENTAFDIPHYIATNAKIKELEKAQREEILADPNEDIGVIYNYYKDTKYFKFFVDLFKEVLDHTSAKPKEGAPNKIIRAYNAELDSNLKGIATLTEMFIGDDITTVEDAQKWLRDHVGSDKIVNPTADDAREHVEFLVANALGKPYKQYRLSYDNNELTVIEIQ